mmetsp:Transcript_20202/g.35988  ORF Transcript_20202/g.35988 Transcript_20202/m.35988 type:complete len:729 (-) Transcript_20202:269-2455(-)|eukprot:CAMPEP_0197659624 /NCGR_PEP_ID=MMETSP1338-20131121/48396_1 /TAXON_ID=43686 ORGANISM="Pelagodinium beii, Strain RCC1491" /NCGR_SAMPLE_ID=MMETSP1338 /ASSEMBLY_ACC=CAM_ASM_000754 /LENGTH=728 /DNA_ID=CAMNT_0043236631 /DNA_START=42 /DNA_END=2228 /DNA_ORIENTATION=-
MTEVGIKSVVDADDMNVDVLFDDCAAKKSQPWQAPRTWSLCRFQRKLSAQSHLLRQLVQPYFLRTDGASGWFFAWLLICVIFIVTGILLGFIAIAMAVLERAMPDFVETLEGGDDFLSAMAGMWHTTGGAVIYACAVLGVLSFISCRRQLSGRRWVGWLLLGAVVFILLVINILNTGIGFIARDLTDALVAKKEKETYQILAAYAACFIIALPIRSLQFFFTSKLAILWRSWLSSSFIESYMGNRAYYVINPNDEANTEVDNPDQRIADDTKTFTRESLAFTIGAFDCLLTFVLNIMVLWSISHQLTMALFAYSGTATIVLVLASHKLVDINYNQLRYEADFRYGLVHIRNNAEAIAFYQGEEPEKQETDRRLTRLVRNFHYLIKWEVIISVLRRSYGYAGNFFPYLLMAPAYLRGEIEYGSFIQAKFAFAMVESALSFVVSNIDEMAHWWAGISRLAGFAETMEDINKKGAAEKATWKKVERDVESGGDFAGASPKSECAFNEASTPKAECEHIIMRNVEVKAPGSQQILVKDLTMSIGYGQRVLVAGPSGCGKTSVLRVASGLWQASGYVERPPVGSLLFVPQRPYMLLGSLREQLCYPLPQCSFSDKELRETLKKVRLTQLVDRYPDLGIKQDWPRLLSLGEQQRLAFARLLLNDPQFVVLDEATSALDVDTEKALYDMLLQRGVAVVSVGHRPTLAAYHDQVLHLQGDGRWRLIPTASYDFGSA